MKTAICAKAADELLTISDITASFVIGNLEGGRVCISGRSIGDINVQVILEKLGGGGHITVAGAQVEGMTIEEVKQESAYLTSEKEKLTDPDYVQSYARGTYMLSKDGEQIFYLPEKDNR